MATCRIPGGQRGARLAHLITTHNPGTVVSETGGATIEIVGPRIVVERWMVGQACWPDSPPDLQAAERFLRHLVLADPKIVRERSPERVVIADQDEGEQALLVRFPGSLKERLARLAECLGTSQNDLVIRAVEDLVTFAEEFIREADSGKDEPYRATKGAEDLEGAKQR